MGQPTSSNRRIAKNTIFLFFRMIVVMLVSLYTTRIVLKILGIDDFGIYNIVGGIVVLFAFLNSAMSNATQRYLSYALGKNDIILFSKTYGASIVSYCIVILIVLILGETVGIWFLNNFIVIPNDKIFSANIVFQFSLLTFIINLLKIPAESVVISNEKMSFYAYLSILDAILRLGVVFLLQLVSSEKLITYAALMTIIPFGCTIAFYIYSKYALNCKITLCFEKELLQNLFMFSGWSLLGATANLTARQGGNILLNIFFGVTVNAAVGIGNQINSAISSLVHSFQTAFRPQIIKLYAARETAKLNILITRTSLLSYYLLFIMVLPLSLNINKILSLWLVDIPPYTAIFAIMLMIYCLIDAIQAPLFYLIYATGTIKTYQIWLSSLLILNLPISYFWLKYGGKPSTVFIVYVGINFVSAVIRTIYLTHLTDFSSKEYFINVICRCVSISIMAIPSSYFISTYCWPYKYGYLASILITISISTVLIWIFGIPKSDKILIINNIRHRLS